MKHWQSVSFQDYLGLVNGGHCFNVTIDGQAKTILLQNPPSRVRTLANRLRDLESQLGRATFVNQQAETNKTYHGSRVTDWSATGSVDYVLALHAYHEHLKLNAANAKAFAQLSDAQRKQLENELVAVKRQLDSTTELAMFTGRVIMQKELWDCGIRK